MPMVLKPRTLFISRHLNPAVPLSQKPLQLLRVSGCCSVVGRRGPVLCPTVGLKAGFYYQKAQAAELAAAGSVVDGRGTLGVSDG